MSYLDYLKDIDTVLTLLLGGAATALLVYYLWSRGNNGYPPGPLALPLIGNLPQLVLCGSIVTFAQNYRRKYGNVFTFEFGSSRRVVVSGYEELRELLIKNADSTNNRSTNSMTPHIRELTLKAPGLFWAQFPHWKTLRSFVKNTIRSEGVELEPQIMEEVDAYIDHFIAPNVGTNVEMSHSLSQASSNIVSQLLFNHRFNYEDETFNEMVSAVNEYVSLNMKVALIGNLPLGRYLMKSLVKRERYLGLKVLLPTLQLYIDEHKDTIDKDNPRDVTDRFLIHGEKGAAGKEVCYSESNAPVLARHLYVAGTETTATALRWALLYTCLNPEVKQRVQEEIEEQIGSERRVSCKDRVNMPYTDAVLLETLRKANIAPVALPRTLERDLTINGVRIPAGADLLFNMASILYDETVFEEPNIFKPERYLTGDIALKKQRTIPFGIGRRTCVGESLARMEMFLFFVTFLQKYDIRLPEGSTVTDEPFERSVNSPKPYEIIFTDRK